MIIIKRTKREEYLEAWQQIWEENKKEFKQDWRMKHVSPFRFTPLQTEVDNFCTVAYDENKPIGVSGFVLCKNNRLLGKQIAISPKYRGLGIGKALLIENEKQTREKTNATTYRISCLDTTAGILTKHWGLTPFKEAKNETEDGIKYGSIFIVDLYRKDFDNQYQSVMKNFKTIGD